MIPEFIFFHVLPMSCVGLGVVNDGCKTLLEGERNILLCNLRLIK